MKRFFPKRVQEPTGPASELQAHEVRRLNISNMIDLAIETWRLQDRLKKMLIASKKEDPGLAFATDKIRDIFSQIGIEVRDLSGQPYNEGMSLDVLTCDYPEGENPPSKIIQETISPAVYFDGKLLKMSQVIIGKAGDPDHGKTDH
jgi:hypothetical protein